MESSQSRAQRLAELLEEWEVAKSCGRELPLEELCPEDAALREALRNRIEALQQLRAFLVVDEALSSPYALPRFIGCYEVQEVVASSGTGIVCRCTQPSPQRDVAVKLLQPLQAAGVALERFRLEAQILGLMKHSGIAQIYEAGIAAVLDNPMPFIAMEYIAGNPLDHYANDKQLSTRQRCELVLALCEAMGHAHRQGVVHRDLKPANVLVTDDGHVKVVDFGIARITDNELRQALVKHDTVGIVGSLAYTSPEQLTGETLGLDERADVYAIGVILFELLTGRLPYSPNSQNYLELIRQVSLERPPSIGSLDRRFKGDLEAIVSKAMEKAPKDRYLSCDHLAADLRRFLRDEPVRARRVDPFTKTWRWGVRNPEVAALLFAIPAILTVSLVIVTYLAVEISNALAKEQAAKQTALRLEVAAREREQAATQFASVARQQAEEMRRRAYNATLTEVQRLERSAADIARSVLLDRRSCPPEYRGLAWHILMERHRLQPLQWEAGGQAFDIAFSPSGLHVVSTASHGQIRFWEALSGKLQNARRGILQRQRSLAFAPANDRLIAATDRHEVRVWSADGKTMLSQFREHAAPITATAIADAETALVASADSSGTVMLSSFPQGERVHTLRTEGASVLSLRFLDDARLLGLDSAGELLQWDTGSGEQVDQISLHRGFTHALLAPSGRFVVASIGREHRLEVFRCSNGEHLKTIPLAGRNYGAFAISPDESLLAAGGGGRIDLWSTEPWEQVNRLEGHNQKTMAVCFGPANRRLASAGSDGVIKIQDTHSVADHWEALPVPSAVHAIETIPGQDRLVVGVHGGAHLVDVRQRAVQEPLHCQPTIVTHLSVAPTGKLIAVQHGDRRVHLFRIGKLETPIKSPSFQSKIREIVFDRDGEGVFATTRDGVLEFWDLSHRQPVPVWPGFEPSYYALAVCPQGGMLYAGTQEGGIVFGHPEAEEPTELVANGSDRLADLAISDDGQRMAAAYRDGTVVLWDLNRHQVVSRRMRHTGAVLKVAFSPDSKTLLSAGRDGFVILWDAVNGDYQVRLDCPAQSVLSVCVSPCGHRLSVGTTERRMWTLTANTSHDPSEIGN